MSRPPGCPFDPPAEFRGLRADEPISRVRLWDGKIAWLVTRFDDVREVLADPRFSADMTNPGFPSHSAGVSVTRQKHPTFLNMDDPEHARHRRMLTRDFMIKRVEGLRPRIQRHVDELLDEFTAGPQPADLVTGFALPVTSSVISELLGVPYEDHEFFQRQSGLLISGETGADEALEAFATIREYLGGLVERKAAEPAPDVISHLLEIERAGGLSRDELINMLNLLLRAGHETTANMIALGTLALLQNPAQLAALKADGSPEAVANAVEELLRYLTITHYGRRRVALEDVEVAGTLVRKGEGVVAANDSANRDPEAFGGNADELDLSRSARHHLTFGYGVHQCLGQPLARVELQVVYPTLLRRLPDLRLAAPVSELPFKTKNVFYGLFAMPVEW